MKPILKVVHEELLKRADPIKANFYPRFFKCKVGEYGEGDLFLGVTTPKIYEVVSIFQATDLKTIEKLLHSKIHEERTVALSVLLKQFAKGDDAKRKEIFNLYLRNTKYINNWDLVDISASKIVGQYLENKPRSILYKLAISSLLWERRISIIATFHFLRLNQFEDTLKISELLLNDREDLIHKAVGWMLREVGKRDIKVEETFLKKHYFEMPRTMLRYSIEKFPESLRQKYLKGQIHATK
jgi:3-methyladenine DNA glycosylase AlkD